MKIIGITGTCGAGKGTIVDYLVEKANFNHLSVRAYIEEEIKRRGLESNRDNMRIVANDLRAKNSPSFILEELYKIAKESGKDTIIESIRCEGEAIKLREFEDFALLAIDAEPKVRYGRVIERGTSTDNVSFEEFLEQEEKEMSNEDPNKQNINKCMILSNYKLSNNGSFEDLYKQIDEVLDKL